MKVYFENIPYSHAQTAVHVSDKSDVMLLENVKYYSSRPWDWGGKRTEHVLNVFIDTHVKSIFEAYK